MNKLLLITLFIEIWVQNSMADDICTQIDSGNYKTVRLENGSIQLISGTNVYTFTEGHIGSVHPTDVSLIFPYDKSPIVQCFANNDKVYYIRKNKIIVYDDEKYLNSFEWNPTTGNIPSLTIKQSGQTLGFFVPPSSSSSGSGQSMSQSNDILVMAYGGSSSVSMSSYNGNFQLNYNGWNIPVQFNAFIDNPDGTITFFKKDKYLVVTKNSNRKQNWQSVRQLFGC